MVDWAASGVGDELRPLVSRIDARTLVVAGEQDRLTPPGDAAWLASRVPAGASCAVADAGHFPHLERPEVVVPAITAHLA